MESITIYPDSEKQRSLLKSLLEELKIRFEVGDSILLSEQEFYTKIDKSVKEAEEGKITFVSKDKQKELLGL